MKYVHVKNLEKYHPGYRDRTLQWCKTYFTMVNADPAFEMCDEIDKWRFICLVMLELQTKNPIPLDDDYLARKGFNIKKRSISLTIQMLHNFLCVVTEDSEIVAIDKEKEEDKEEDKDKHLLQTFEFDPLWERYPKRIGKKEALRHFKATVKNEQDYININRALDNYCKKVARTEEQYIQQGRRWFNNWADWDKLSARRDAGRGHERYYGRSK
jgi:hypothetical protein